MKQKAGPASFGISDLSCFPMEPKTNSFYTTFLSTYRKLPKETHKEKVVIGSRKNLFRYQAETPF